MNIAFHLKTLFLKKLNTKSNFNVSSSSKINSKIIIMKSGVLSTAQGGGGDKSAN